ncbi:hypothetical protein P4J13_21060 [Bacillus anthracis]|uniref:hypothetical protein n=1 Tax=Bacillus anthracis TaxID=1392 RepID=UPI002DB92C6F|nr:hypothetical protein [Bacillus anthracis]MEB9506426.1 hypothetical protein [Bacillus anthracis]
MRIISARFKNESYNCDCNEEIESEKVNRETWECNECKEKIAIDIGSIRDELVRLHPNEISKYDYVFNRSEEEFCAVKDILHYNGKYYICIEGYGKIKVEAYEFVDCMRNQH